MQDVTREGGETPKDISFTTPTASPEHSDSAQRVVSVQPPILPSSREVQPDSHTQHSPETLEQARTTTDTSTEDDRIAALIAKSYVFAT
jgi:hypothetical protein